jgi:peptidyl-prolyl cis-trans isomerase C
MIASRSNPRILPLLALLLAGAALTACGPEPRTAPPPAEAPAPAAEPGDDPILARIGLTTLRHSDVMREAVARGLSAEATPDNVADPAYQEILDGLIDQRLMAIEARRRGLDDGEDARIRLALAEERILGNVLLETVVNDRATEETVRRIYEAQIRLIPLGDEVRARHILVETREEAEEIKRLLDGGADFAELAIAVSQDAATRLEGGDLGYFTREGILPAFASIAFSTSIGEVSDPFPTEFGWHVLTVLSRRREQPPSMEELEPEIRRHLMFDEIQSLIEGLRAETRIERYEPASLRPDETAEPE